jgi:hypothetical protein
MVVRHENKNDLLYKVKWEKKKCIVKNQTMFSFVPTRTFKRELAKAIKEGGLDYFG